MYRAMSIHPFTVTGLQDETLDSVIARTFKLHAFRSWRYFYEELCGIPGRLPLNGISGRLDEFAAFFGHPLSGAEMLRSLTLWNGFSAFMSAEDRAYLAERLSSHREVHSSSKGQAKPRTRQPFRFCEACVREDHDAYGIGYWHRSHQMPLVNLCWKHGIMLRQLVASRGHQIIPMPGSHLSEAKLCGGRCAEDSKRFASFAHDILACDILPGRSHLKEVYWKRMDLRGLTFGTRIHYKEVASQCAKLQDGLDTSPHLNDPSHWLANVLYSTTSNLPMHLILVASLFDQWSDFLDACLHPEQPATPQLKPRVLPARPIGRQVLQKAFEKKDTTVPQVAHILAVSANTVRTCARYYGIAVPSRKGSISSFMRQAIGKELRRGFPQRQISTRHGVSLSTIDIIRRSSEDIDRRRRMALEIKERDSRRRKLRRYLARELASRRSDVRTVDGCLYKWLLRHDREWFDTALPQARVVKFASVPGESGDDERDG